MKERIEFSYSDDDGDEVSVELPARYEVCAKCEGKGAHMVDGMREHAYTMEEFQREFDDDEREAYFNGGYDVTCTRCDGNRVELVVDEKKLEHTNPELLKLYREERYDRAAYEAECAAERKMGC